MAYLDSDIPQLRVGTGWTELRIASEVGVRFTRRGYAPCLLVDRNGLVHLLYASAVSLADPLEHVRRDRGSLEGLKIRIRKARADAMAPYEVECTGG